MPLVKHPTFKVKALPSGYGLSTLAEQLPPLSDHSRKKNPITQSWLINRQPSWLYFQQCSR